MKVFQINICPDLSTGGVMNGIADAVIKNGGKCITACPPKNVCVRDNHYVIGNNIDRKIHIVLGKLIGFEYSMSLRATIKLINKIEREKPDIVHLHNMHSYYINLPVLMNYLAKTKKKVVWTFHDCWPITGHCPHFVSVNCNKWRTGCRSCPLYKQYPYSMIDTAFIKYRQKKKWFARLEHLTIVTPSEWLCSIVQASFLQNKSINVINNGIDLSLFTPAEETYEGFRKYSGKKIVLGVSSRWDYKKGLDVFVQLSEHLTDEYKIVLVGTDEIVDQNLPNCIESIHRTADVGQLARIYSSADVFVNPTREDTFPTVNMEALACGTPVITFDTGGSPEIISEACGVVIKQNDIEALEREVIRICEQKPYNSAMCRQRALKYGKIDKFQEYVDLYKSILQE